MTHEIALSINFHGMTMVIKRLMSLKLIKAWSRVRWDALFLRRHFLHINWFSTQTMTRWVICDIRYLPFTVWNNFYSTKKVLKNSFFLISLKRCPSRKFLLFIALVFIVIMPQRYGIDYIVKSVRYLMMVYCMFIVYLYLL